MLYDIFGILKIFRKKLFFYFLSTQIPKFFQHLFSDSRQIFLKVSRKYKVLQLLEMFLNFINF